MNIPTFLIPEEEIEEINAIRPDFELSEKIKQVLKNNNKVYSDYCEKCAEWDREDAIREDDRARDNSNWDYYNDNLDMDQQSSDFWNQF